MEQLLTAITSGLLMLLASFCLAAPPILTGLNLFNLFSKKPIRQDLVDILTFGAGPFLMWLLYTFWNAPDWDVPLYTNMEPYLHAPLASWHLPTILVLALWAIVSFWLLRFHKEGLPPLPLALFIAGAEVGIVLSVLFCIQLAPHLIGGVISFPDVIYMALFPINYLLCIPRALRSSIARQVERFRAAPPKGKPFLDACQRFLSHSLGWMAIGFLLALPVLALLLAALVLFGQAPDAALRAFTETSDWALSQKISPPPIEYHGHYLCTVAVGGHPKVVKPTRYGLRHGKRIVVNRQLCVANAFEDLIHERWPRFHRAVRNFYDAHGYPLSQHLTTPLRADVTYLVMKPLEWLFLLVLYAFDPHPEDRIARQYTGL